MLFYFVKKALAPLEDIAVGGVEVIGEPRVCDVRAPTRRKVEKLVNLAIWVGADYVAYVAHVERIHHDDVVKPLIVARGYLPCLAPLKGYPELTKLGFCAWIHVVSELLGARRGGLDVEIAL